MPEQKRTVLDREVEAVHVLVGRLGALVDMAIESAMDALVSLNVEQAARVVERDAQINELRFEIEAVCLAAIARQQPAARDLREIVAAMNIVLDLERMGDHAAGMAKSVLSMMEHQVRLEVPNELLHMAEIALGMLREVMSAYESADVPVARQIPLRDDVIDQAYRALFHRLLDEIVAEPDTTEQALYLMFAGHNLERVADRVTNVAERIVFASSGEMEEMNVREDDMSGVS